MDEDKWHLTIIIIGFVFVLITRCSDSDTEKTIHSPKKPRISVTRQKDVKTIEQESINHQEIINRKNATSRQENMIEIGTASNTVEKFGEEELVEKRKQVLLAIEEGFNLIDRELERATP